MKNAYGSANQMGQQRYSGLQSNQDFMKNVDPNDPRTGTPEFQDYMSRRGQAVAGQQGQMGQLGQAAIQQGQEYRNQAGANQFMNRLNPEQQARFGQALQGNPQFQQAMALRQRQGQMGQPAQAQMAQQAQMGGLPNGSTAEQQAQMASGQPQGMYSLLQSQ